MEQNEEESSASAPPLERWHVIADRAEDNGGGLEGKVNECGEAGKIATDGGDSMKTAGTGRRREDVRI